MNASSKRFAQLAAEMKLSPHDVTVLTVLARHADKQADSCIQNQLAQLSEHARQVADVLSGKQPQGAGPEITRLAELIRTWSEATTNTAHG